MVDEHLLVCDGDGNLAVGSDALQDGYTIPQYIVDMTPKDSTKQLIMSYNSSFFKPS